MRLHDLTEPSDGRAQIEHVIQTLRILLDLPLVQSESRFPVGSSGNNHLGHDIFKAVLVDRTAFVFVFNTFIASDAAAYFPGADLNPVGLPARRFQRRQGMIKKGFRVAARRGLPLTARTYMGPPCHLTKCHVGVDGTQTLRDCSSITALRVQARPTGPAAQEISIIMTATERTVSSRLTSSMTSCPISYRCNRRTKSSRSDTASPSTATITSPRIRFS